MIVFHQLIWFQTFYLLIFGKLLEPFKQKEKKEENRIRNIQKKKRKENENENYLSNHTGRIRSIGRK